MGAGRQSYKLSLLWKYGGRTNIQKIHNVLHYIKLLFIKKYAREYFILDNIITPYNKRFKCKYGYHHFRYDSEDDRHYCKNCGKTFNENDYKLFERIRKIKKLRGGFINGL